jgi:hypothetical protein
MTLCLAVTDRLLTRSRLARTYPHDAQLEYFRTSVLAGDTEVIGWQLRQEWQSFRVAELAIRLETNAHFFGKHLSRTAEVSNCPKDVLVPHINQEVLVKWRNHPAYDVRQVARARHS